MGGMSRIIAAAAIAAMCATPSAADPKSPKLARCDGKSRRPANPYGSILPSVDPAAGTVSPAAPSGIDVFPPAPPAGRMPSGTGTPQSGGERPPPQVPPIGAIVPPNGYRSC